MDKEETLRGLGKKIEEISDGLYDCYCFPFPSRRLPYLDIYNKSTSLEWVCRVELLEEMDKKYRITSSYSSNRTSKKVGKDNLLMEVLKELWIHG